jgi:hypothetical protein
MFSRSAVRYAALFFVTGSLFGASVVFAYIAPTADVQRASSDERVAKETAITPWSEFLSKDAVDSGGAELDLDGNASALVASPPWSAATSI